jgi:hypothetical protein
MILGLITLLGCDGDPLEQALKGRQRGMSADQWLEQYAGYRPEWDRVGLVFGYGDDQGECEVIANLLMQSRPRARYRCVPAN